MRRIVCILPLVALLLTPLFVLAADGPPIPEDVIESIKARVDNGEAVGIVVGLAGPGEANYFARGSAGGSRPAPVDQDTLFEIGSATKVFTALLLADMVQRGELSLDEQIGKLLPEGIQAPSRNGTEITLKHLVTHRSSLPRLPSNFAPKDPNNPYVDYTVDNMYEFLSGYKLQRDIDSRYEYSNYGMGLLGQLLARKAGKSYDEIVVERICKPLGMESTGVKLDGKLRGRLATGHVGPKQVPNWDITALAGAGALRSSARDMIAFIQANMGSRKTDLLPAMRLCHSTRSSSGMDDLEIGLGWHIWKKHDTEIIWHNGQTGGYHSFIGFRPDSDRGVVVLTNSATDVDDIGLHLLEPKYVLRQVKQSASVSADVLQQYVGYYELAPGAIFHITREGDKLFAQLTGQDRFQIYPESESKFFYRVADAQITFLENSDGKVDRLILHQHGMDQTAARKGPDFTPPPERVAIEIDPAILDRYTGKYELQPGAIFEVTKANDQLLVQLTGQPAIQVYPESETKFFYKVADAQITFVLNGEGKVEKLVLHQFGMDMDAKKIE